MPTPAQTLSADAYAEQRAAARPVRLLVWLYLVLWLTEGALRKWFLPSLANPLLVVRDPVLLLAYLLAYTRGVFPKNFFVAWISLLGAFALLASIAATDAPMVVELYGLRASYLHLPLIFLIPAVFSGDDVRRVGFWTLVCAPPMAVLVVLQFFSKPTATLNAGAGGAANVMLESAFGHIRPSGTFSFTNGLTAFTVIVAVFFLWQLFEKKLFPRLLWLASGGSLVFLIAFSGSRSVVGAVALILVAVLLIGVIQPRYWASAVKLLVVVGLAVLLVGSMSVFQSGLQVFSARFGSANNVQTGFLGRFFFSLYAPFTFIPKAEPLGVGLGMGTNVASGLRNKGKRLFMLAEGDMSRVIMESGPFTGLMYELMRTTMTAYLGMLAFGSLTRRAYTLPMLMFSGTTVALLTGEFAQPTELGYAVLSAGLCLAANNPRVEKEDVAPATPGAPRPGAVVTASARPVPRGRSLYAERLHGPDSGANGDDT